MFNAVGIGTVLQIAMVVLGHFVPSLQAIGLFPIAGTLIGGVTGWMAGRPSAAGTGGAALMGGFSGAVAGALGSLVSTALGDVPLSNAAIAGGATLVSGAIGGALAKVVGRR